MEDKSMDFKETMRKAIEGDEEALSVINEPISK